MFKVINMYSEMVVVVGLWSLGWKPRPLSCYANALLLPKPVSRFFIFVFV